MKIFLTGGTGFIGSHLVRDFLKAGYHITVLTRSDKTGGDKKNIKHIQGDLNRPGDWQNIAVCHDGIVNLAGASIFQRWNKRTKEKICQSRVRSTRNVVDALIKKAPPRPFLISASAVGYYGFRGDEMLDERSSPGSDFMARVAKTWEAEAQRAGEYGVRTVVLRFGSVLGRDGGALLQFDKLARYFFGARLGKGEQWVSWIHIGDLIRIFHFFIENRQKEGVWNAVAPHPVKNKILIRTLTETLNKPSWSPSVPGFLIKMVLGEFGETVLHGQRVIPRKLNQDGFSFKYPDIQKALCDLYQ
ncbi:MAG: TIGR01777 family oxidoreductase [Candidatus Aminicenantes bacterium]